MSRVSGLCKKIDCFGWVESMGGTHVCGVLKRGATFDYECPFYCSEEKYKEKVDALYSGRINEYMEIAGVEPRTAEAMKEWVRNAERKFPYDAFNLSEEQKHNIDKIMTEGQK